MSATIIDKKKKFSEEGKPLLEDLRRFCAANSIPFFFSACVQNDESGSVYVNDGNMPGSGNYNLKDDKLSKYLAVAAGFDVIPSRDDLEIIMDAPELEDEE